MPHHAAFDGLIILPARLPSCHGFKALRDITPYALIFTVVVDAAADADCCHAAARAAD